MNIFLLILLILVGFSILCINIILVFNRPLPTVKNLNLNAYLGTWHQVASSPAPMLTFQRNGYCITAQYSLKQDGTISVYNSMNYDSPDGPIKDILGYAYIPDENQPGKLKVHFDVGFGGDSDYYIVALGPIEKGQYQWAVVTEPKNIYMWVLVRNKQDYQKYYEDYLQKLVQDYYNFDHFWNKYTPTDISECFEQNY